MPENTCYHCGDPKGRSQVIYDHKAFCCHGCKTVYEILQSNDLAYYYELQQGAGASPKKEAGNYNFLDNPAIAEKLLEFDDGRFQVINLYIPHIHCSSCIWILENLGSLHSGVSNSQVDFPKKTVRITYNPGVLSLKAVVELLVSIGYEPYISLDDLENPKIKPDRGLLYKLGVAGFAFGNVMFLSFPEYFELAGGSGKGEFWLEQYTPLFRWLIFTFSLPVLLYSSRDYFIAAYKGLRGGIMNIDVPIALGILALFIRSTIDILFDYGPGYFDSFTGLVFFLLLGRFFQQKTYAFLSFERDYKSYFPIAVTRITNDNKEDSVPVYDIQKGERILIRNQELIPADGLLLSDRACIDYSFVTGESDTVYRKKGDQIYAGGRQVGSSIDMEVLKPVSQSYLTQLWGNEVFRKNKSDTFRRVTDRIGKRFTIAVLTIACLSAGYWLFTDPQKAAGVFTAVLIIACPCAIALAAPFTLGNLLRILGKKKFYLKNADTIEQMAQIDTVIFDKTGTMTASGQSQVTYDGMILSEAEESLLKNTLRASSHPLSRKLYELLKEYDIVPLDDYREEPGKGIEGNREENTMKIGSSAYVDGKIAGEQGKTEVHVSSNDAYKGRFVFNNSYREGLADVFKQLSANMQLAVISGDNEGEKARLEALLPKETSLYFHQKPDDKLRYIEQLQAVNRKVMMVGDGLNDAGALAQSNVGIAISENVNVFSPACDGILDASKFRYLPDYIRVARMGMGIIRMSFALSLIYNVVGLYFAVTGQLQPVIAAILMPLSSISIVAFTTIATNYATRKLI